MAIALLVGIGFVVAEFALQSNGTEDFFRTGPTSRD